MSDQPFALVLGTAQDGGLPHAGCRKPCCEAARNHEELRRLPACLALIDPKAKQRFIIDCTPEFPRQLELLDAQSDGDWRLAGVLLTHAHIGHYTGLIQLCAARCISFILTTAIRSVTQQAQPIKRWLKAAARWRSAVID